MNLSSEEKMNERVKALEIKGLEYSYRSNWLYKRFTALKPLDLEVYAGESFGFLGPNGAGKTTTIKCILGLVRRRGGSVKIFGVDSDDPRSRLSVGYIPEQPYFYDNLTVREILNLYATLAGVSSDLVEERIDQSLARVNLVGKEKSNMRSLSKGQMQRVALAQAIINKPQLLILDEPFSGLDPIGRKEFKDVFAELKTNGTTLFMSSHILSDVEFLCDRVSVLARGELQGVFETREIPRLAGSSYELTLCEDRSQLSAIEALSASVSVHRNFSRFEFQDRAQALKALRMALDAGFSIESYQFAQGSLEDLFVKLVKNSQTQALRS